MLLKGLHLEIAVKYLAPQLPNDGGQSVWWCTCYGLFKLHAVGNFGDARQIGPSPSWSASSTKEHSQQWLTGPSSAAYLALDSCLFGSLSGSALRNTIQWAQIQLWPSLKANNHSNLESYRPSVSLFLSLLWVQAHTHCNRSALSDSLHCKSPDLHSRKSLSLSYLFARISGCWSLQLIPLCSAAPPSEPQLYWFYVLNSPVAFAASDNSIKFYWKQYCYCIFERPGIRIDIISEL